MAEEKKAPEDAGSDHKETPDPTPDQSPDNTYDDQVRGY